MQPVFPLLCRERKKKKNCSSLPSTPLPSTTSFNLPAKFTGVVLFPFIEFGTWWIFLTWKLISFSPGEILFSYLVIFFKFHFLFLFSHSGTLNYMDVGLLE